MCHIFFIHSSVYGHSGCLHVLAIVNSAAVNTVRVSFWISIFSRYTPRSGTTGWCGNSIFSRGTPTPCPQCQVPCPWAPSWNSKQQVGTIFEVFLQDPPQPDVFLCCRHKVDLWAQGDPLVTRQSFRRCRRFWPGECQEPGPVEGPGLRSGHPVVLWAWALPGPAPSSKPLWNSPLADGQTLPPPPPCPSVFPYKPLWRVDFSGSCSAGAALQCMRP